MKRLLFTIFIIFIWLSLFACGSKSIVDSDTSNSYTGELDNITASETNETTTELEEGLSKTEPQFTTIEINIDNWTEYFELKPYISIKENAFGEFEYIDSCCDSFQVKEKYIDKIKEFNNFGIEVEFGESKVYRVEYNITTRDICISNCDDMIPQTFGSGAIWFDEGTTDDYEITSYLTEIGNVNRYSSNDSECINNIFSCYTNFASSYKIIRIQGQILLES